MFVCSVQIISALNNQTNFQMWILASYVDRPLARHGIFLPQKRLLKPRAHSFPFVCARQARSWQRTLDAAKFCKRLLSVRKSTNSDGITNRGNWEKKLSQSLTGNRKTSSSQSKLVIYWQELGSQMPSKLKTDMHNAFAELTLQWQLLARKDFYWEKLIQSGVFKKLGTVLHLKSVSITAPRGGLRIWLTPPSTDTSVAVSVSLSYATITASKATMSKNLVQRVP